MTTYRLPDGAEVRAADSNLSKVQTLANHTWVIHPTLGAISCYTGILTPVLPPLPPEPPIGTVLFDGGDRAWQRVRDEHDPPWRHDSLMCSWETMVRENGPLTLLVPDHTDDARAQAVLDAAQAWVAYVHNAPVHANVWADDHDHKLIEAVDAYNTAREVQP